jgi:hypothetical protein
MGTLSEISLRLGYFTVFYMEKVTGVEQRTGQTSRFASSDPGTSRSIKLQNNILVASLRDYRLPKIFRQSQLDGSSMRQAV